MGSSKSDIVGWGFFGEPIVVNCEDKYEMVNRYYMDFLGELSQPKRGHYVSEDGRAIVDSIGSAVIKFDFDNVHETRTKHIEV